jgi:hypothetical protein
MKALQEKIELRKNNCEGLKKDLESLFDELNELIEGCNLKNITVAWVDCKEKNFRNGNWVIDNYNGDGNLGNPQGCIRIENEKIGLYFKDYYTGKYIKIFIENVIFIDVKQLIAGVKKLIEYLNNLDNLQTEKDLFSNLLKEFQK